MLVAKELGHSHKTVTKYWVQAGLPTNQSRKGKPVLANRLSEEKVNAIRSSYYDFDGRAYQAGNYLGICGTSVIKYWKEANLHIRRKGEKNNNWLKR